MALKNKLAIAFLMLFLMGSIFFLSGCGEKAECESSSDCVMKGNPCVQGRCSDGKCVRTFKDDCCGNSKCEADGGENKCSCPSDCGNCTGKIKYNVTASGRTKTYETVYARYLCINKACAIGVDPEQVVENNFRTPFEIRNAFNIELVSTINTPFDASRDNFKFRFTLNTKASNLVGAITITRLQVMSGTELMGEKLGINQALTNLDESFTEEMGITSAQSLNEATKRVDLVIGYRYSYTDTKGALQTANSEYKTTLADKLVIIVQD
jgi:hypothetical protein